MLKELFSMRDKVCLVTGGSSGIGSYITRGFLEAGARRVYITSRKADACEAAAKELSQYGECVALPGDMASLEEIERVAAQLAEREDHLDVLVNNAGTAWAAPLAEYPEAGWDKVMDLNAKTPFFLTKALVGLLTKAATPGSTSSVVNISSIAGSMPAGDENYAYGASKAALDQLTTSLALRLARKNVRVNTIAPGRFYSKMTSYVSKDPAAIQKEFDVIPLQRWGGEGDIAGVAVMLASPAGAFITGEVITVDGGFKLIA
jgi:NAD(P)-dependent dehydrogenase (short-subunit alcohol dehydrogenase family)